MLVVADDLDVPTTSMLPQLPDLMANRGLSFTRMYATQPLCGPSRASILTGQYSYNHGVFDNDLPYGFPAFRKSEAQSLAPWLKSAGYRTSLVGKYLNNYASGAGQGYIPPGWDDWHAHLTDTEDGRYFDYWMNHNGEVVRYGSRQEDYSVDVEAKLALEFIRSSTGRSEPLFMLLAPQAPHVPAKYAERFGAEFHYALAPRTPNFNESAADKPSWVRGAPPFTDGDIDWLDKLQRFRLRSMRAVEDELQQVLTALADTGRLDNTYVFFTSDNGLLMGQHRGRAWKSNEYEETIGIPLIVRGPGVPVGTTDSIALTVDLAPTFLELAGVAAPASIDGRSLVPFLRGRLPSSWRTDALIINFATGFSYTLRNNDWMYNHQDTEEFELYDMHQDPYQLKNLFHKADPALIASLNQRINTILACRGLTCRS